MYINWFISEVVVLRQTAWSELGGHLLYSQLKALSFLSIQPLLRCAQHKIYSKTKKNKTV